MGKKVVYFRCEAKILEFIEQNLLEQIVGGVPIHKKRPQVIEEIFLLGFEKLQIERQKVEEADARRQDHHTG